MRAPVLPSLLTLQGILTIAGVVCMVVGLPWLSGFCLGGTFGITLVLLWETR